MMLRKKAGQRGLAAVEFGLVLPVVAVMLFAIFEFGMAFWRKQVLTAAVREGARAGIVKTDPRPSEDDIRAAVLLYLDNVGYTDGARTVDVTGEGGPAKTPLTVTATYPTSFVILSRLKYGDGVDSHVDGSGVLNLNASVTMMLE
jgi:Flp pilus assembly protein TadG